MSINIDALRIHGGAVHRASFSSADVVMANIKKCMHKLGLTYRIESPAKIYVRRPAKHTRQLLSHSSQGQMDSFPTIHLSLADAGEDDSFSSSSSASDFGGSQWSQPPSGSDVPYGPGTDDSGGEVRFTVELTRIANLGQTFTFDIKRRRGSARSYQWVYHYVRMNLQQAL